MNSKEFKQQASVHLSSLAQFIEMMPWKGDKEEDSQKICLRNGLNRLNSIFQGIEDADLKRD